jgi:hypothetical protein
MKPFGEALGEVLGALLEHGFELPIHVGIVSRNGCAMWFVYVANDQGSLDAKSLAEFVPHEMMTLPINIMLVDSCGEAARVLLRPGEQATVEVLN